MLTFEELIKDISEEKYILMLKQVNICDFTKCIAQFSGLPIQDVSKEAIKKYLLTWAKNKYRFYEFFGGNLKKDTNIEYEHMEDNYALEYEELGKRYPAFGPWLKCFSNCYTNKIKSCRWELSEYCQLFLSRLNPEGMSITHFLKRHLNAPDELVTEIGRLYENQKIQAIYTMSIDPVDIMLSSETPYGWRSCYALNVYDCSNHADGCLAAVLDDTSLITYIWNKDGDYQLYEKYKFKHIRYKIMRQTISISPQWNAIHFNSMYPGKSSYNGEFLKQIREIAENAVADYLKIENNTWTNNCRCYCERAFLYGYGEYYSSNIWRLKDTQDEMWDVFNEGILCPCGCGSVLPGSDEDEDYDNYEYIGDGFICSNFSKREQEDVWCDYAEDYCSSVCECCEDECYECRYWQENHSVCELEPNESCSRADYNFIRQEDNRYIMESTEERCCGCPLYEHCSNHSDNINDDNDNNEVQELTIDLRNNGITSGELLSTFNNTNVTWHWRPIDYDTQEISYINLNSMDNNE